LLVSRENQELLVEVDVFGLNLLHALIAIDEAKARLLEDLQNATEIAAIGKMVHSAHRIVDIGGRGVAMAIGVRFPALELIMRFLELDTIESRSHVIAGIETIRRGEEAWLH